jgi:hypothetical protein
MSVLPIVFPQYKMIEFELIYFNMICQYQGILYFHKKNCERTIWYYLVSKPISPQIL